LSPLFKRPGSTSGMALDPAADRHGQSPFVTGIRPSMVVGDSGVASETPGSGGLRMLVTGFVEGRFDWRSLTDGELFQSGERDRFQDALLEFSSTSDDGRRSLGARAAAFATGEVGDNYQLTLRVDTEKDPTRRLFNDIRPEEAYDVFGDASATLFEAQSKGRVFGAVSRGGSYLMYGDYNTSTYDSQQLLGRYSRTLNGVLHQYESERAGFRAFASRDRFQQIVDEIPAMGISGPYALSRADGLLNSERVEIITRDRNQPGVILDIQPLERFTDYTIEPFTGRLVFRRPIASLDDDLNPISIRVSYESEASGESFWVYGADGQAALTDRISLGAGFVRDDSPRDRFDLFSANAGVALGENTWLSGEFARSDREVSESGNAMRVELRHASEDVDLRWFYLAADSTFQNPSAGVGVGRTEMGLEGSARVAEKTSLLAEVIRSEDDRTDATLTGGRVALRRMFGERFNGQLSFRHASEEGMPGGDATALDDVNALGIRLETEATENGTLFGEFEQDVTDSDARRLVLGGDYRVLERMRLYARHEFLSTLQGPYTLGRGSDRNSTVFGVSADYREGQSVFSEYRAGNGISGRGAHAAIGLRNQWELDEGIRVHATVERVSPMDSVGSGAALAVTGGLELTTSPVWKATLRGEYRATELQDHVLGTLGYARKLSDQFTILAQSIGSKVLNGGAFYERTRLGLAYRGADRGGLYALARYEHRTDEDSQAPEGALDHKAHIFSTHVNLRPLEGLTARAQWAAKFATDRVEGQKIEQSAQLLSGRATVDLSTRLDLGIVGRTLIGEGRGRYGLGVDLGVNIGGDLRLGLGYNWFGFTDDDLSLDEYTDKGFFIDLGWRFDESLFGLGDDDDRRVGEDRRR
ncbi:MAG: hypothetical protein KJN92_01785, partial [Gemmatimonadetes bacterium]|nr:hypothetical protein [Gemmatimonadota bacterium]